MPFFSSDDSTMAKDKTKGRKKVAVDAEAGAGDKDGEKPLPLKRPGTSGTENMLMTTRREASEQFAKAQKAERAYRSKKQATLARQNYNETKEHFREGFSHLGQGIKGIFAVLMSIPYLISEKREQRRKAGDAKRRQRDLERKKKLEEALARQAEEAGDDDAEDKADEA